MSRLFPAFPLKKNSFSSSFFSSSNRFERKKKRDPSLCLFFFVCVSYLGFQILKRERERKGTCVSLSLSPLRLFLLRRKKPKKEQQNFSQKKTHRKGVTCKLVLTFKYTHKHNTNNNVLLDPNCCRPIRPRDRAEERRLQTVRFCLRASFFSSSSSFFFLFLVRSFSDARAVFWKKDAIAFLSRSMNDFGKSIALARRETMMMRSKKDRKRTKASRAFAVVVFARLLLLCVEEGDGKTGARTGSGILNAPMRVGDVARFLSATF